MTNKTSFAQPTPNQLTLGDLGGDQHEIEYEPINEPGVPEPVVAPMPEPVAVPA